MPSGVKIRCVCVKSKAISTLLMAICVAALLCLPQVSSFHFTHHHQLLHHHHYTSHHKSFSVHTSSHHQQQRLLPCRHSHINQNHVNNNTTKADGGGWVAASMRRGGSWWSNRKRGKTGQFLGRLKPGAHEHDEDIFGIAGPALITLLVDPILSIMDTAYVGRLGSVSLASLGPCTSIFHLSFNGFRALAQSTTALVSQSMALGNRQRVR